MRNKDSEQNSCNGSYKFSSVFHVQFWEPMLRGFIQVVQSLSEQPLLFIPLSYLYCFGGICWVFFTPFLNDFLAMPSLIAKLLLYVSPLLLLLKREMRRRESIKQKPDGWIEQIEKELAKTEHPKYRNG